MASEKESKVEKKVEKKAEIKAKKAEKKVEKVKKGLDEELIITKHDILCPLSVKPSCERLGAFIHSFCTISLYPEKSKASAPSVASLPQTVREVISTSDGPTKRSLAAEQAMDYLGTFQQWGLAVAWGKEAVRCAHEAFATTCPGGKVRYEMPICASIGAAVCAEMDRRAEAINVEAVLNAELLRCTSFFRRLTYLHRILASYLVKQGNLKEALEHYHYAIAVVVQKFGMGLLDLFHLLTDFLSIQSGEKKDLVTRWIHAIHTTTLTAFRTAVSSDNYITANVHAYRIWTLIRNGYWTAKQSCVFEVLQQLVKSTTGDDCATLMGELIAYIRRKANGGHPTEALTFCEAVASLWERTEHFLSARVFWDQTVQMYKQHLPTSPLLGAAYSHLALCDIRLKQTRRARRVLIDAFVWYVQLPTSLKDPARPAELAERWTEMAVTPSTTNPICLRAGCTAVLSSKEATVECPDCKQVEYCSIECKTSDYLYSHQTVCSLFATFPSSMPSVAAS